MPSPPPPPPAGIRPQCPLDITSIDIHTSIVVVVVVVVAVIVDGPIHAQSGLSVGVALAAQHGAAACHHKQLAGGSGAKHCSSPKEADIKWPKHLLTRRHWLTPLRDAGAATCARAPCRNAAEIFEIDIEFQKKTKMLTNRKNKQTANGRALAPQGSGGELWVYDFKKGRRRTNLRAWPSRWVQSHSLKAVVQALTETFNQSSW